MVETGQYASVLIDAYPEHPFHGRVAEVTAIPTNAMGPFSDVKVYYAMVDVDTKGFSGLRPGLSAEVSFAVDARRNVTRVPVKAVRWSDGTSYVAVPAAGGSYTWKAVKLGLTGPIFAEVVDGLKTGDRIVADPEELTPPRKKRDAFAA